MTATLRVGTINLLNDHSRWPERRTLLARSLAPLGLDLIALQEVTDPLGKSTAHTLADDLGGYQVFLAPKTGQSRSREGIAILSRLAVEGYETLDLGSQETHCPARQGSGARQAVNFCQRSLLLAPRISLGQSSPGRTSARRVEAVWTGNVDRPRG